MGGCLPGWTSSVPPTTSQWYFCSFLCIQMPDGGPEFSNYQEDFSRWDKVSHGSSLHVCVRVLPVDRTRQSGWPFVWTRRSCCLGNLSESILVNPDPRGSAIWVRNREEEGDMDRGRVSGRQKETQTKKKISRGKLPPVSCISLWTSLIPRRSYSFLSRGLSCCPLAEHTLKHEIFLK